MKKTNAFACALLSCALLCSCSTQDEPKELTYNHTRLNDWIVQTAGIAGKDLTTEEALTEAIQYIKNHNSELVGQPADFISDITLERSYGKFDGEGYWSCFRGRCEDVLFNEYHASLDVHAIVSQEDFNLMDMNLHNSLTGTIHDITGSVDPERKLFYIALAIDDAKVVKASPLYR